MSRSLKALGPAILLVLMGLFLSAAAVATELPDDLIQLMPADPDLIVSMPSGNELDRAWGEMRAMIAQFDEDDGEELKGLKDMLSESQPQLVAVLDWTHPLAITMTMPNVMAGEEPQFAFIVPVSQGDFDFEAMAAELEITTLKRQGNYLLLSQNPEIVMGTSPSPLLDRLPVGTIAMCANLKTMWSQFAPLLDFALMSATAPQPQAEGEEAPPQPDMSPEEVAALGDMVRMIMDSADMVAFGADLHDNKLSFTEEFVAIEGSVLDPGPQPDFQKALDLTRFVDSDADWVGAYALAVDEALDVYKDFYLISLQQDMAALKTDIDLDMGEVMEDYFQTLHQFMVPGAFAMNFEGEKIAMSYVLATTEGQAIVEKQMQSQEKYGKAFPFLVSQPADEKKIEGHEVIGWDFEWKPEELKSMMEGQLEGKEGDEDAQAIMTAVTEMYQKMLPGIRMLATNDHFFMTLGRDVHPLKDMVKKAKKNKGKVNGDLTEAAQKAGPHCQAVFEGDLATVMSLVFEIVEEFSEEDLPALEMDPMPLRYTVRVDDLGYGVDYLVDLKGLPAFVKAIEELDAE